jgi:diguanylate cyclase (GGDEF)-like protein
MSHHLKQKAFEQRTAVDIEADLNTRVTTVRSPRMRQNRGGVDYLVVIYAPLHAELGKRYLLDSPVVTVGRRTDNDIVLPGDCVSRQHLRIERRGALHYGIDVGSTNGTFLNDSRDRLREQPLKSGDQLKVGDTIFKYLSGSDVEAQYHEIIFDLTNTDGLTGLANRKHLDAMLNDEVLRAQRHGRELSMLMLDLDHFKRINDSHGHLTGDAVLRSLALLMRKRLRPHDKIGRYGGEEFCVILPETPLQGAVNTADELRRLIEAHPFPADRQNIHATASIGVSALRAGMSGADLYKCADEMLYRAKRTGRNRVCAGQSG